MGQKRSKNNAQPEKYESNHQQDLGINGMIILNWILQNEEERV
jgi:hypothetical protein